MMMDKRKRKRLVGRILSSTILLAVVALIGFGFVPKPVPATVAKVERRTLEVTVDEPGKTRVRDKYVISAQVSGQLSRIRLQVGDEVAENALVAEIAPLAPQLLDERTRAEASARVRVAEASLARTGANVKRAEGALKFASDEADRERKLQSQGGSSQQARERAEYQQQSAEDDLASARLGARVADSELSAARAALASMSGDGGGRLELRAPVRGQVLRVLQESEGVVQAGTPLLEIGNVNTLEIVVDVLSTDAVRIALGAPARVERWGGPYPLSARVRRKQPSAFTTRSALGVEEQRVPVLLDLTDDPARFRALGDGYRVDAHIRVANIERAVVVPGSALFREQGVWSAFSVREGRAHKAQLETGARTPDWVEVKTGLAPGDEVVLYPSDQVRDGVKLKRQSAPRQ